MSKCRITELINRTKCSISKEISKIKANKIEKNICNIIILNSQLKTDSSLLNIHNYDLNSRFRISTPQNKTYLSI